MMRTPRTDRAFTLAELLVVMAVIAVLLGVLLPAVGSARRSSKITQSQANLRNITLGFSMFSAANREEIISCCTEKEFNHEYGQGGQIKCKAWVDARGDNIQPMQQGGYNYGIEQVGSLHDGYAWPYIGSGGFDGEVYRSPLDSTGRIRTYSLNGAIGHVPDTGFMSLLHNQGINTPPARSMAQVRYPQQTLYAIPEVHNGPIGSFSGGGWNLHGFIVNFFSSTWIDTPAFFTRDGIELSFLDGHTEFHLWEDKDLWKKVTTNNTYYPGLDFDYIRSIMMPQLEHHIGADG